MADAEKASVEVSIGIGKLKEKTFDLKTKNITVTGLPNGGSIKFALESVAVTISGLESDINALTNTNLKGAIDVTGLEVGTHQVPLMLDLDETKYMYKSVKVKVDIEERK